MVKVHHFKIWNQSKNDWEIPPSKRTMRGVIELKGKVLPDSSEDVERHKLDDCGRFFPSGPTLHTPVRKIRQKYSKDIINEKLDEALEQSFPASDPLAVGKCSQLGEASRKRSV